MRGIGRGRGRGRSRINNATSTEEPKPGPTTVATQEQKQEVPPVSVRPRPTRPMGRGRGRAINNTAGSTIQQQVTTQKAGSLDLPKRPGYGTTGRRARVATNFFEIAFKDYDIYHYDIAINPSTCPRALNRQVIERLVLMYQKIFGEHKPVYDGQKNVYTVQPLPIGKDRKDFDIKYFDEDDKRERQFKVSIKWVACISMHSLSEALRGAVNQMPYDTITAMDIALRHLPSLKYISVGRSFFSPPDGDSLIQLGHGREVWFGYHQSIRPTQWKMMVNLDTCLSAFYKPQPTVDYLCEVLEKDFKGRERRELFDYERLRFAKEIKGLKVVVTHLGIQKRKYKVSGVTTEAVAGKTFKMDKDGAQIDVTVASYFEEKYQVKLFESCHRFLPRYPYLPCLQVGVPSKGCFLPMEVCNIVSGQRCVKRLSEKETAEMIRASGRTAQARKEEIKKIVAKAAFAKDEHARYFGLEVKQQMAVVNARVLEPPMIQYSQKSPNSTATPRNGAWDMRDKSFHCASNINVWALLIFATERQCNFQALNNYTKELSATCMRAGMTMTKQPIYCDYISKNNVNVDELFSTIVSKHMDLDIILVVLPGKTPYYAQIKSLGDTFYGIPTQCIQLKNVTKTNRQTLTNLCMKINAKLGGINGFVPHTCKPRRIFDKPVLFLGADVTHPSPGDIHRPSIAAVVGSIDAYPINYCTSIRVQQQRKEIITDLTSMVKELLQAFYRSTRVKPFRIIMYRDGVSEGQFQQVVQNEVKAIREACMLLEKGYEPGISFIVVQKRHHTRFFPEQESDKVGKAGNVPPGTTVDTGICHPTEYDFYLCSHAGIQGTSRPAHYHVLWDDNELTPDELHQLTFLLCHTYVRCTRSVSIPAPAYYAHLAAFRARFHIDNLKGGGSDSESTKTKASDAEGSFKASDEACKPHANLSKTIYFA